MSVKVILPKQGLQMTEGTITEWLAKEGDEITNGQPLFVMETDKTSITVEAEVSGVLQKILAPVGSVVQVAETVAIIGLAGEDASAAEAVSAQAVRNEVQEQKVFISPRAKAKAEELNIDYSALKGSAPDGMITEKDIPVIAKTAPAVSPKAVPLHGIRGIIAARMKQSLNENAQASHRISVRMDRAEKLISLFSGEASYNSFIAFAVIRALQDFPAMNAELTTEGILEKSFVNLGIAVALDKGLVVPVVKNAQLLSLKELHKTIKSLAEKARTGKLRPEEYQEGSFTISNLGMYGLEEFTAIINPPESGILAIGKIEDTPVAENNQIVIKPLMKLTLSYDHRVIDGAPAARFLSRVKEYLENPQKLL